MTDCEIQTKPPRLNREQEPAIAVSGLRHSYRRRGHNIALNALDDLTFDVAAGQFVCILGPNGSGKSTLISVLLVLSDHTSGRLRFLALHHSKKFASQLESSFKDPVSTAMQVYLKISAIMACCMALIQQ